MPGPAELWIILIIVLVIFGGSKIPEIMKGIGKGMKEFKKARNEIDEIEQDGKEQVNQTVQETLNSEDKPKT